MFLTRIFFELFWIPQRISSPFVSIFCNTMDVKKSQRVHFHIFQHCSITSFLNIFRKFLKISQGSALIFFICCNQLESHKAQRVPPFTILSLRYSADFGCSRLVCANTWFVCVFCRMEPRSWLRFFSDRDSVVVQVTTIEVNPEKAKVSQYSCK